MKRLAKVVLCLLLLVCIVGFDLDGNLDLPGNIIAGGFGRFGDSLVTTGFGYFHGIINWDSTETRGTTRSNEGVFVGGTKITKVDGASASLNFGVPGAVPGAVDLTITVTGAAFGDQPIVGAPVTVGANYTLTAFVSAANTVTVRWYQHTGAAADPDGGGGGTYTVRFLR